MIMRSSNPTLNDQVFRSQTRSLGSDNVMTVSGTTNKTLILLSLVFLTALWSWDQTMTGLRSAMTGMGQPASSGGSGLIMVGLIGGLIAALVTIFKKTWAPYTSPIYALFEGLALGSISAIFELSYPGIAFQAILGTFGTFFLMLLAYRSEMIRATPAFKKGIAAAIGGIFFIYLISFVLSFFGKSVPFIHESGPIGIGFSVVVVGIAAFSLIMDFDFIEQGERMRAPKYMEWYGAFGLLVTLVWLYLEILKLLSKLAGRSRD